MEEQNMANYTQELIDHEDWKDKRRGEAMSNEDGHDRRIAYQDEAVRSRQRIATLEAELAESNRMAEVWLGKWQACEEKFQNVAACICKGTTWPNTNQACPIHGLK
jgi:hypothetical protein